MRKLFIKTIISLSFWELAVGGPMHFDVYEEWEWFARNTFEKALERRRAR